MLPKLNKTLHMSTRTIALAIVAALAMISCTARFSQPELGYRTVPLIEKGGYQFKDLDKDGALDPYEDWRLSPEKRADDLLSKMDIDEKVGFMIISQINMVTPDAGEGGWFTRDAVSSELNEEDVVTRFNQFTGEQTGESLNVSGTTKGIKERHLRHFILRANASPAVLAQWANNVQAVAEDSRLGIPAIFASNPRNHVAVDNSMGLNVGNTCFTQWPGTLGLAAANDTALVRRFARTAAAEWVACGIRKGYMYQLDLSTEPRWSRIEGTFGEDADRVAAIAEALVEGFQGKALGLQSVALTMKHFPGGGPEMKGWDSHYSYGKDLVYPGNMFDYHIKPFKAAVDAGVAGIMPYYAEPFGTPYEEVGSAFNHDLLDAFLRDSLGFKGIINSDTGPINNMPWGVEDLTIQERYQKAVCAGTDLFSGGADIANLKATYEAGLITEAQIDVAVRRLLVEKFKLGLFENPYVDVDKAVSTANCEEFRSLAAEAFRKSVVLLRNEASLLPLKAGTKVYFERLGLDRTTVLPESKDWDVEFVSKPSDADVVVLWLFPSSSRDGFLGGKGDAAPISNTLSDNSMDVDYIRKTCSSKPTVVITNFSKPWVMQEIDDSKYAHTWMATFGTTLPAVMDVLTGEFSPVGKLPFGIPASQEMVELNKEDVPSFLEQEGYALFECGYGLSYPSGL